MHVPAQGNEKLRSRKGICCTTFCDILLSKRSRIDIRNEAAFTSVQFHGTWYWDSTTDVYSASISCDREKFHFSTKVNHHGQRSDHLHIDEEYWYGGDHQHHIGAWVKTLDPRQRAKYHGKYTHYGPGLQEINFWFIATVSVR